MTGLRLSEILRRDVPTDPVITGVTADSRRVGTGTLFAALPGTPMNSDQWMLLKAGNRPSGAFPGLKELGIAPRPIGLFLDRWMTRYRKYGRFNESVAG